MGFTWVPEFDDSGTCTIACLEFIDWITLDGEVLGDRQYQLCKTNGHH
jgi:hypothetical protein